MKVLLVEDDPVLGKSLEDFLNRHSIDVTWIQDDRQATDVIQLCNFDVIVLDLILKYNKGENILRELRFSKVKTPILILTAKRDMSDKTICFERGADDYLTKPFEPEELLLRLRALSRREHKGRLVKIGRLTIDLDSEALYDANMHEIKLSRRTWDLLYILAKHQGKLVTKEQILSYVWGDTVVGDEIIRTYIKDLRRIMPKGSIETIKGRGYKLRLEDEE
jgi:DNA-binding response OmpR family regulator